MCGRAALFCQDHITVPGVYSLGGDALEGMPLGCIWCASCPMSMQGASAVQKTEMALHELSTARQKSMYRPSQACTCREAFSGQSEWRHRPPTVCICLFEQPMSKFVTCLVSSRLPSKLWLSPMGPGQEGTRICRQLACSVSAIEAANGLRTPRRLVENAL